MQHRWALSVAALGLVGFTAVGAAGLKPTSGGTPPERSLLAAVYGQRTAGSAPSTAITPPTANPLPAQHSVATHSPDCAPMGMQPVPPPPGSTQQPVPGLCYTPGSGQAWEVGCAPGFGASCGAALQGVLNCLREVGAHQPAGITEASIWACAGAPTTAAGTGSADSATPQGAAPSG